MSFSYSLHSNGSLAVIQPDIPIESRTCGELKSLSDQLIIKGVLNIIIDADKTEYISSEGLQVLFALNTSLIQNGGKLIISRPTHEVSSLFNILHMGKYFTIIDTLDLEYLPAGSNLHSIQPDNSSFSQASAEKSSPVEPTVSEEISGDPLALVVECESCGAFVRVNSSGSFLCPSCQTEFSVAADGTVIF